MTTATVDEGVKAKRFLQVERIRNIGVVAHIDSGKTTITERMLKLTGRIRRLGEVHDGEATMDFLKEERERGITIGSAATHFLWAEHHFHLIDTPGHVDFTAEVERSLRVLDGAVLAVDAVAGAQAQSETVNRQMNRYHVPRLVFVNKMDRVGADFGKAMESLEKRLGLRVVPLQMPVREGSGFSSIVDLVSEVQYTFPEDCLEPSRYQETPIAPALREGALRARQHLLETLSLHSDELLGILLEGRSPPVELVQSALRRATCRLELVPCLCGAALRNVGIPQLLTAVVDYLPSPLDKGAMSGHNPVTHQPEAFEPDPDAPLGGMVFKTVHFPVGDLTFVRLYSGSLSTGDILYNPRLGRTERVGRLFKVHAATREAVDTATAGEIVACMGLKESATGDTLCTKGRPISYSRATFAKPVISMALEAVSNADSDRLAQVLAVISREDPTFHFSFDEETGETIISGMGELHLEVVSHRIRDDFRIPVTTGVPKVAYRQTFARPARIEARHIKQTGGSGQYAVAVLEFQPIDGDEVEFVDEITQGRISREFVVALEKGIRAYLLAGGRRGAQIQGVRATVVDGKMHEVDSSTNAFHACGNLAARMAEEQCQTILLEPTMRIEVTVPEEHLGAVLGDLNSRRAVIGEVNSTANDKTVVAKAPLAELRAYSTTLRSLTSGRGDYSMEPEGYQPVPPGLVEEATPRKA